MPQAQQIYTRIYAPHQISSECIQRDIYKNAYGNTVYNDQKKKNHLNVHCQENK